MIDIPFERYLVSLRLKSSVHTHFHHAMAVHGIVSTALGSVENRRRRVASGKTDDAGARGVIPFDCEMGRTTFDEGDFFHLGLTLAGPSIALAEMVLAGLERAGSGRSWLGSFTVHRVDKLPAVTLVESPGATEPVRIRFTSPLRLERPDTDGSKRYAGPDWFEPAHFLDRLWRRLIFLRDGRWPRGVDGRPALSLGSTTDSNQLVWIDIPGDEQQGTSKAGRKTLGGALGSIMLGPLGEQWAALVTLGQYLHLGAGTNYGLGAWRLTGAHQPLHDFRPARTVIDRIAETERIEAAADHIAGEETERGLIDAALIAQRLREGTYEPGILYGFLENEGGKIRAFAVPSVRDRVVQRAVCDVLSPSIDTLLEDCSYAYRKGFSRGGAARAIQEAWQEGYRFVLDADIASFFDAVPWAAIVAKLEALFPTEPLIPLIERWISASVIFEDRRIDRTQGLPQGAPISPLLANLYLDELDDALLGEKFRLVRYADDFVVLCRSVEEAEQAREAARLTLSAMGLKLHEDKTSIRSMADGFTYLGYLFCRSVVLDAKKEAPPKTTEEIVIGEQSWLGRLPVEEIRALVLEQGRNTRARPVPVPLVAADAPVATTPLYVLGPATTLRLEAGAIVVEAGGPPVRYPIKDLSHVIFLGRPRCTIPVVVALCREGVPVFFCHRSGELDAVAGPPPGEWTLWRAQADRAADPDVRRAFAQEVAAAKIRSYATLARKRIPGGDRAAAELRGLEKSVWNKTEVESIRGVEGRAGAVWFAALQAHLGEEWNFHGRKRRPSPDPVNAMLSFGYSILYQHAATALIASGLNPAMGIYHQEHEGRTWFPMAADLQEEVRHLADGVVLTMIHRRQVSESDFHRREDGACLLGDSARRSFVGEMESRLSTEVTGPDGVTRSYRDALVVQARRIRALLSGRSEGYVATTLPE